jgi:uncharacterized protein (TIGR03435 family)
MYRTSFQRAFAQILLHTTIGIGSLLLKPTPGFAQAQPKNPKVAPFDVVSIKSNRSGSGSVSMRTSHGTLTVSNATVRMLIHKGFHVRDSQISGGPAWLDTERYDIVVKTERTDISDDNLWLSLQPLLAERFRLRIHREDKQLPVYSLVAGKGGPRLRNHSGDDQPTLRSTAGSGKAKIEATKTSMPRFAASLAEYVDRPIIDNTQMKGEYDFKLEWAQDHPGETSPSMLDSLREQVGMTGPSVFTAVQEQLGLKLQPTKGPVEIIVVDGPERASAN